ncbi:MAG: hypothetical protein PHF67_04685 [Candidatus Nanoarchaeia archaeon]|nr:hypothetical protein [Candidatus Nanoarchaeia archaeon]
MKLAKILCSLTLGLSTLVSLGQDTIDTIPRNNQPENSATKYFHVGTNELIPIRFMYDYPKGFWVDEQYNQVSRGTAGAQHLYPNGIRLHTDAPDLDRRVKAVELELEQNGPTMTKTMNYILQPEKTEDLKYQRVRDLLKLSPAPIVRFQLQPKNRASTEYKSVLKSKH